MTYAKPAKPKSNKRSLPVPYVAKTVNSYSPALSVFDAEGNKPVTSQSTCRGWIQDYYWPHSKAGGRY